MLGSGLKVIFQWFTQAFILLKSLFKLVADKFITEKKWNTVCKEPDICCEAVCKVVYIVKNNNGTRIEACSMPVTMLDHQDSWPFNTTLCFLKFKKSLRVLTRLPDMPFCFNLKIGPSIPHQKLLTCLRTQIELHDHHQKICIFDA